MIPWKYPKSSMQIKYNVLSENQKKVLEEVISYIRTNNIPPTTREIQHLTGLSPRGVTLQLNSLEKQEFIKRKTGARGILVNPYLLQVSQNEKISVDLINAKEEMTSNVEIPLMTPTISAGLGNLAEEHIGGQINVPLSTTKGMRNVFAVKISGDSMIRAGIEDGDIAIIAPQQIANDGDVVAAIHEGGVTLKRFRIIDGRPILIPANPQYEPITKEFSIQGKMIGIIKN